MFDLHCHILPSVDDGSDSLETSLALLNEEIQNGVSSVVLTPHQNEENICKDELIKHFEEFKKNINLDIKLYLGSEIYYYDNLLDDLNKGKMLTINNTKYVLVEFSTREQTDIPSIVYDLKVSGYKPIVAHIERYDYLTNDDLEEIAKYALIQVNAKSFERKEYKKVLKFLLKNKLVSFVASDAHNLRSRNVDFSEAKKIISKKYKDQYDKIFNSSFEALE